MNAGHEPPCQSSQTRNSPEICQYRPGLKGSLIPCSPLHSRQGLSDKNPQLDSVWHASSLLGRGSGRRRRKGTRDHAAPRVCEGSVRHSLACWNPRHDGQASQTRVIRQGYESRYQAVCKRGEIQRQCPWPANAPVPGLDESRGAFTVGG